MNKLIKLDDLEYPVTITEFKARHKASFPSQIPFEDFGYAVVFAAPKPATTPLQRAIEGPPVLTELGTYAQTYTVVDITTGMSQDELDALAAQLKDQKIRALAPLSAEKSTGTLTIGSLEFRTNDKVLAEITAAISLMGRNPAESIDFKGVGGWGVATKAVLEAMQDATWGQRKAASATQRRHEEALHSLVTPQEIVDYDTTTGW